MPTITDRILFSEESDYSSYEHDGKFAFRKLDIEELRARLGAQGVLIDSPNSQKEVEYELKLGRSIHPVRALVPYDTVFTSQVKPLRYILRANTKDEYLELEIGRIRNDNEGRLGHFDIHTPIGPKSRQVGTYFDIKIEISERRALSGLYAKVEKIVSELRNEKTLGKEVLESVRMAVWRSRR